MAEEKERKKERKKKEKGSRPAGCRLHASNGMAKYEVVGPM